MVDTTTAAPAAENTSSSAPASAVASTPLADTSSASVGGSAQPSDVAESSTGSAVSPGSVGDFGEKFIELPDRYKDPAGFQARLDSLTDAEMDLFADGKIKTIDTKTDDPASLEKANAPAVAAKPGQEAEIASLSPEQFAALPAYVKNVIQGAQAKLERLSEYEADLGPLLDPKARQELDSLLDDPRVRSIIDQRQRGDNFSFDHEKVMTPENISEIIKSAGVSIDAFDGLTDPEGTMQALSTVLSKGIQIGIDAGKTRSEVAYQAEAKKLEYTNFFENGLKDLTGKIDSLKSGLNHNDGNHPVAPFVLHLQKMLGEKKVSFEYLKELGSLEPIFVAWQATQKGGLGAIIRRPEANLRNRLVREMTEAATNTAVNSAGRGMATGALDGKVQYGVDATRYLSDPTYRDHVLDQNESNEKVMNALGRLGATGKW
jgi:hypothetical protein